MNIETKDSSFYSLNAESITSIDMQKKHNGLVALVTNDGYVKTYDHREGKDHNFWLLNMHLYDVKINPFTEYILAFGAENNFFYVGYSSK